MVSHKTSIDPNYPVNYPSEWSRPSPVMVLTGIIHIKYMLPIPSDDDDGSVIGEAVESRRSFWSVIGLFKSNEESRLNDLSPEFASLDIALPFHREIANGIFQELLHILESDEECILKIVVVLCTIMLVNNYSERIFERMIEESIDEYERRMNYGMVPSAT